MTIEADDRGRVYLPKKIRQRHGEQFRLVDLPTRIVFVPVADDPLEAVQGEAAEALGDTPVSELKREAREAVRADVDEELDARKTRRRDEE